jgi:hypothetical protein
LQLPAEFSILIPCHRSDPVFHEVSNTSISWINDLYGAAMKKEFTRQKIKYFNEVTLPQLKQRFVADVHEF